MDNQPSISFLVNKQRIWPEYFSEHNFYLATSIGWIGQLKVTRWSIVGPVQSVTLRLISPILLWWTLLLTSGDSVGFSSRSWRATPPTPTRRSRCRAGFPTPGSRWWRCTTGWWTCSWTKTTPKTSTSTTSSSKSSTWGMTWVSSFLSHPLPTLGHSLWVPSVLDISKRLLCLIRCH